ncbi:Uma2 family endonuclease [Thermus sp.]|uniref:Uma2 family endonuclease n=1 Tax=Thermus sp. TaxID=275 RepID=UPI002604CFBD|nr:Uma2 family endonuclease [Thermus sp.]MCX7850112.1 Uma2 family endonuclease [Thermus sp.]
MTRHRISLEEFHRMVEAGVFPEDLRLELVEGELLEMSPIGKRHAAKVARLTALFAPLVPEKAILFVQSPLAVGGSELYPDLALLRPREDFYEAELPRARDALLVVEVADTPLDHDLGVKLPLYARAGVAEVWVVDLGGQRVLVHREPQGEGYGQVAVLGPGEALEALEQKVAVEALL